jgi:hypothetical protein
MHLTLWIVLLILIVAAALGFVGSWFSLRTLRLFTCLTAIVLTIAVTRLGFVHATHTPVNLVSSFLNGVDQVIIALLHPIWPGKVPVPGVAGRWIIAVVILLGYRLLEERAIGRQAPELDLSAIGSGRPAGHTQRARRLRSRHDDYLTTGELQAKLAAELRFRLPTMEVRTPSILPGGSRTNALASIAETSGVTGAGMVSAVVRFAGMIWPTPRLVRVRSWVESESGTRITVLLENVKTGLPIATKTVAGECFNEAASMVTGYIAQEIFVRDQTVPEWCYGMADGRDLGAMQLARLERFYAACDRQVCESRKAQIRILSSETGTVRTAGIVRYELAQLLALDEQNLESCRLHALNRELHPRFYRGRYRFAMSLEMIANPEHYFLDNTATLRKLAEALEIISRYGRTDSILQGYAEIMKDAADLGAATSASGGVTLCLRLPGQLARELLRIAQEDLRDVRAQLGWWHVLWAAFFRQDERAVWRPHRRRQHRRSFQDGICAAELLVALRCRLHDGDPDIGWLKHGVALWHLRRAIRITWCIAGYPALIVAALKNPSRDWRDPEAVKPKLDLLSRAWVHWPLRKRRSTSWQAAYNTACLYAALADRARRSRAPENVLQELERRVIVGLQHVLDNPQSELERAWDWIDSDPDFRAMRDHPANFTAFAEFLAELKRQEYPASTVGRCPLPHTHPAGIIDAAARRAPNPELPIRSPVPVPVPLSDGVHAYVLVPLALRRLRRPGYRSKRAPQPDPPEGPARDPRRPGREGGQVSHRGGGVGLCPLRGFG